MDKTGFVNDVLPR